VNRSGSAAIRRAEPEPRREAINQDHPIPSAPGGAVPLVVAVTGHRDLVPAEIPRIRERVQEFLRELQHRYADRSVGVMSALAEGADQLVAEEALALGIPLTVTMPMPKALYLDDFATPEAKARFERLCAAAVDVFELPLTPGNTVESISGPGPNRSRQYAQVGVFMCAHCHVLLALWDGKDSDQLGGTSQVVRFHHDDVMPGFTPRGAAGRLVLADDESDLVYHIVCSARPPRRHADGGPHPARCELVHLGRSPAARRRAARETSTRVRSHERVQPRHPSPRGQHRCRKVPAADQGAGRDDATGSARHRPALLCGRLARDPFPEARAAYAARTHVCVFLTGLRLPSRTRISDPIGNSSSLVLAAMAIATLINSLAQRGRLAAQVPGQPHARRGFAVQFYWAAAGVTSGIVSKFAHDNFLQMQDPELGWIRNVMRVAGTECDIAPNRSAEGLEFAVREWIGDPGRDSSATSPAAPQSGCDTRTSRSALDGSGCG
jgi:hypothetical protein